MLYLAGPNTRPPTNQPNRTVVIVERTYYLKYFTFTSPHIFAFTNPTLCSSGCTVLRLVLHCSPDVDTLIIGTVYGEKSIAK